MRGLKLVVIFLGIFAAQLPAQEMSVISGKLLGYDGKPMLKAHIHLLPYEFAPQPAQRIEIDKDGSFQIKFKDTGLLYLEFTGVNHYPLKRPLWVEKPLSERLTVRLKLYPYVDDFSQIKIIGDFNNFESASARPMVRQEDGTFIFEMDTTASTFAYQILGAVKRRGSINGTQSDDFVNDNQGDYRSVIKVNNGKVKIVFDPKKLLRGKLTDEAVVQFDNPNSLQAQLFAIEHEQTIRWDKFWAAEFAYSEAHNQDINQARSEFSYDWSGELTAIAARLAEERNPILRQILLQHYLRIGWSGYEVREKLDKKLIAQAFAEIPPTSSLWIAPPMYVVAGWTGEEEKYESYLNEALEKHSASRLRAGILGRKLEKAAEKGDTATVRIYYNRLIKEFGDSYEAERAKAEYDPNRAIMKGKKVPDFSVASLDQTGMTHSNESMKGKTYLMDFWAVWCKPCVEELPNLHQAYEKFKDRNFEILSLSFDPKSEVVTKFRSEKWKMPWLHAFVEKGFDSDLAKAFQVMSIPKPILADGNINTILATGEELRGEQLEKTLARVLGEKSEISDAEKR